MAVASAYGSRVMDLVLLRVKSGVRNAHSRIHIGRHLVCLGERGGGLHGLGVRWPGAELIGSAIHGTADIMLLLM